MTPTEKAIELVKRFSDMEDCEEHFEEHLDGRICKHLAKQCALVVAGMCYDEAYKQGTEISAIRQQYWSDVTAEIHRV